MSSDDAPTPATPPAPPRVDVEAHVNVRPLVNPPSAPTTSTLYGLGRRITSRTTDLLAIAIVLIASLTMGRQMLRWWHDDTPAVLDMGPLDNLRAEWGTDSRPVSLEFGDSPVSMTRQEFATGGLPAAINAVRERCQALLVTATPPDAPRDQAESDQLDSLATLTPDSEQPGTWQLFTITDGLPMIVGVRTFELESGKSASTRPLDRRRVVCWGLVFPGLSPGSWTAYTFVRRPAQAADSTDAQSQDIDLSRLELPAGSRRTVLMQEAGQSGLLGFQGVGKPDAWQQHLSTWFQKQGWTQPDNWEPLQEGWSGRFVRREPGRLDESTIHVQCYQQSGQGLGLVQWFPGRKPAPESPPATSRGTP